MFRFTIRDVLMFTALVAICVTWLLDRDKIHLERAQLAKREAELTSENKMWKAEAKRASLREQEVSEYSQKVRMALQMRGMDPKEVVNFNTLVRELGEKERQRRLNQPTSPQKASPDEN